MESNHCIYIALGSNLGNRKAFLQRALVAISRHLGQIQSVSQVYETQSWGFDSNPFYNACIKVLTHLSALECLSKLQEIEAFFGRKRHKTNGYEARTIDLDILFYDHQTIQQESVCIPHAQIPFRRFVLTPLLDIAPDWVHHTLHKTIQQLWNECSDDGQVKLISEKLFIPKPIDFASRYNYIAIEGNIGAGKTTLATLISEQFQGKLLLERYMDNPFLEKFYKDNQKYGFALEMSFLTDRYIQVTEQLQQLDLFKNFVISDYDIFKSLIFAGVTLSEDEYSLYRKIFYILYKEAKRPDLYVYLLQNSDKLLQNIEKRGRVYEKQIPKDYLDNIQHSYLNFLRNNSSMNILFVDMSDLDFVENQEDYYYVLSLINNYE